MNLQNSTIDFIINKKDKEDKRREITKKNHGINYIKAGGGGETTWIGRI